MHNLCYIINLDFTISKIIIQQNSGQWNTTNFRFLYKKVMFTFSYILMTCVL